MITVYIASPYTKGDVALNVRAQIDCAKKLRDLGYNPFVPLLTHFEHIVHPRPYGDWLEYDIQWMLKCDCLLRLPGDSKGADKEVEVAYSHNKPVFYSIEEVENYFQNLNTTVQDLV